jgi:hypothetical protein
MGARSGQAVGLVPGPRLVIKQAVWTTTGSIIRVAPSRIDTRRARGSKEVFVDDA